MIEQNPIIRLDPKIGKVWCITQYLDMGNGTFKTIKKFDITDQVEQALDKVYMAAMKQTGMGISIEKRVRFCVVLNSQYTELYSEAYKAFEKDFIVMESEFDCELSETQKRKLELADMVYVLNNAGYISPIVGNQIKYALQRKKQIYFCFPELNTLDDYQEPVSSIVM